MLHCLPAIVFYKSIVFFQHYFADCLYEVEWGVKLQVPLRLHKCWEIRLKWLQCGNWSNKVIFTSLIQVPSFVVKVFRGRCLTIWNSQIIGCSVPFILAKAWKTNARFTDANLFTAKHFNGLIYVKQLKGKHNFLLARLQLMRGPFLLVEIKNER